MNQIEKNFNGLLDMGMDVLSGALKDVRAADLDFTPAGDNVSLGELCREMGDVAEAYVRSFATGAMDFSARAPGRNDAKDGPAISAFLRGEETRLKAAVSGFSDEELATKTVDRGGGWRVPLLTQFHVYREALLIFFGKLDIYLRLLKKVRPESWRQWVG